MGPTDHSKLGALENLLLSLKQVAVALSGGVDSSFLLAAANRCLGESVLAISVKTPYVSAFELEAAIQFCLSRNIRHRIVELDLSDALRTNPPNRCYLCKHSLFSEMKKVAHNEGFHYLADGSNADDSGAYRPGRQALNELGIISPLLQCGFTKTDIRTLSREWDLPAADTLPNACLLTRIPYNQPFDAMDLRRIEAAEDWLRGAGFGSARVRTHNRLARLETSPHEWPRLLEPALRLQAIDHLKQLGYLFVTIDLEGYRSGCYDEPHENMQP